jgi:hypothetical protein
MGGTMCWMLNVGLLTGVRFDGGRYGGRSGGGLCDRPQTYTIAGRSSFMRVRESPSRELSGGTAVLSKLKWAPPPHDGIPLSGGVACKS